MPRALRRPLLALAGLALAASMLLGSCFPLTAAEITCGEVDDWFAHCDPACGVPSDCELLYDSYGFSHRGLLDECAACIADGIAFGVCEDCLVDDGFGLISCVDQVALSLDVRCRF